MSQSQSFGIKRALLSVFDKNNIVDFAKKLHELNIEILSTGGTAKLLQQHHIPVIEVSDYTGFPEIMEGRVKTLHPKIHGGLLGRRGIDESTMQHHEILPIDLLVINLYPFEKTIANPQSNLATAIENIDIGGPAMLRAGAKNYAAVTVIIDPSDYAAVLEEIQAQGDTTLPTRFKLGQKVFAHTAKYDAAIANYLSSIDEEGTKLKFPEIFSPQFIKKQDLRYGENPHQQAALYYDVDNINSGIACGQQLQGKELSFNNIADADAALECVNSFSAPACVIVKHANPCGVALGNNLLEAYQKAYATDPISAFGGIIAFNSALDEETIKTIIAQQFVEVIIAPSIAKKALEILKKKPAVRMLCCEILTNKNHSFDYKRISGGLLVQDRDLENFHDLKVVTKRQPSEQELKDLLFAWQVAKFVKSNAIVFAKDNATIGIGAGQMSRVDSVQIAITKAKRAGLEIAGSVMASDAFFPFRDSVEQAAAAGTTAIIQPGGSIRDEEVIEAANQANMAMIFTGMRHFRH